MSSALAGHAPWNPVLQAVFLNLECPSQDAGMETLLLSTLPGKPQDVAAH